MPQRAHLLLKLAQTAAKGETQSALCTSSVTTSCLWHLTTHTALPRSWRPGLPGICTPKGCPRCVRHDPRRPGGEPAPATAAATRTPGATAVVQCSHAARRLTPQLWAPECWQRTAGMRAVRKHVTAFSKPRLSSAHCCLRLQLSTDCLHPQSS